MKSSGSLEVEEVPLCDPLKDVTPKRSGPVACLLCWKVCTDPAPCNFLKFPGAEGVTSLQDQLSRWFVLRKVLEVPSEWLEDKLGGVAGGDGQSDADSAQDWFQVCSDCLFNVVAEAWHLHRQIVELERKLEGIRQQVKRNIRSNTSKHGIPVPKDFSRAIRQMVMPDLLPAQMSEVLKPKTVPSSTTEPEAEPGLDELLNSLADLSPGGQLDHDPTTDLLPEEGQVKTEPPTGDLPNLEPEQAEVCVSGGEDDNWRNEEGDSGSSSSGEEESSDEEEEKKLPKRKGRPPMRPEDRKPRKPRIRNGKLEGPKQHECTQCCTTKFRLVEDFQRHQKLHEERKLNAGVDEAGRPLDCPQCSYPGLDHAELAIHIRKRHGGDRTRYKCPAFPDCSKETGNWVSMVSHVKHRHVEEVMEHLLQRHLHCDKCPFQGKMPRDLRDHQRETHPFGSDLDRVWKCDKCEVICVTEGELRRHTIRQHVKAVRFVCDTCGRGFWTAVSLRIHEKSVHQKDPLKRSPWVCHICAMDFSIKRDLNKHVRKCEEDAAKPEKTYRCKMCNFQTTFCGVLRRHIEVHKAEGDCPWKCEQCVQFFSNKHSLAQHMKLRHFPKDEEPVKCPSCHRAFRHDAYLKMHLRRCRLRKATLALEKREVAQMLENPGQDNFTPTHFNEGETDNDESVVF